MENTRLIWSKGNSIDFDREDEDSIRSVLTKETYDVIYDNIAYTSNDIDILMRHVTTERYIVTSSMSVYPTFHDNLVEKILIQQHMLIVL